MCDQLKVIKSRACNSYLCNVTLISQKNVAAVHWPVFKRIQCVFKTNRKIFTKIYFTKQMLWTCGFMWPLHFDQACSNNDTFFDQCGPPSMLGRREHHGSMQMIPFFQTDGGDFQIQCSILHVTAAPLFCFCLCRQWVTVNIQ